MDISELSNRGDDYVYWYQGLASWDFFSVVVKCLNQMEIGPDT